MTVIPGSNRPRAGVRRRGRRRPGRGRSARRRTAVVVVAATTALLVGVVLVFARPEVDRLVATPSCTVTAPSGTFEITASQARYAATIAAVGERDGMPDHAVSVALATALQESKLRDLQYGDRDSLGLFQQRPSEGWGTPTEILDPVYSANAFYAALARVSGWQEISVTDAAQDVQHSAAPQAYESWAPEGRALAEAFTGEAPAALSCRYAPGTGLPAAAITAAATDELGASLAEQTAMSSADGWRLATWLVARGQGFGLAGVTFDGSSWSARTGRWSSSAVPAIDQVTFATNAPVATTIPSR